jgi:sugar lactone lactonase YvrE
MMLQTYSQALASFLLILAATLTAKQPDSAVEQFHGLQAELHKSQANNDWHSYLTSASKLKELMNEAPDSLLEVARAEVRVGDFDAAFHELEQFARMGQSADLVAASSDFAVLLKKPNFAKIEDGMKANRSPVSLGSTAFVLPDSSLLAEDVDYDPGQKKFFITSVREKKIISTGTNGVSADFARAPDDWPMLAIKVDPRHGVLWATEVAMQGFKFSSASDWGRSALLCYDLKTGKLLRRIEGPRPSALGDMVLTANGDVIVSDGDGGGVYRVLTQGTVMERLDGGDFISPQTPAMHPDGKHIFVSDYVRGIGILEIATKRVRWLSFEGRFALNGVDGLYFDHGRLIAVQNGTSPERVVVFTLDAAFTRIESETIVERSTDTLGDPTHGVIIANDFYYIANSGWDVIDEHGNMKPGTKASAPRMMRAPSGSTDEKHR